MQNKLTDNLMPQDDTAIAPPKIGWGADDVIILIIGALLSLYTMWRSADFLSQTIPNGLQFRELVIALGVVGMDVSMWAWAFTWLHWSRTKNQKNLALGMFILTSLIVTVAAVTDAAIYFFGGTLEDSVRVIAFFIVIGGAILVALAAFAYHNMSPKVQIERDLRITKSDIEKKRAQYHSDFETKRLTHQAEIEKRRMTIEHQLEAEQQDLELSERLVRSRNASVERAKQVARLKADQDHAFEELHNVMRFVGEKETNGNGHKPPQPPAAQNFNSTSASPLANAPQDVIGNYKFDEKSRREMEIVFREIGEVRSTARNESIVLDDVVYNSVNDLVGDAARLASARDLLQRLKSTLDQRRKEQIVGYVPKA